VLLVTVVAILVVALFFLGRWLVARIGDYPATLFGPLDPPPHSS
jgi:flagellar biosynthesis protein FliQ